MNDAILQVRDLTVRHGGVVALDRVDLSVESGQVVGLITDIGPNWAVPAMRAGGAVDDPLPST